VKGEVPLPNFFSLISIAAMNSGNLGETSHHCEDNRDSDIVVVRPDSNLQLDRYERSDLTENPIKSVVLGQFGHEALTSGDIEGRDKPGLRVRQEAMSICARAASVDGQR
jgi:hypothetical protein